MTAGSGSSQPWAFDSKGASTGLGFGSEPLTAKRPGVQGSGFRTKPLSVTAL
jgi:hypothetical protein